MFQVEDLSFVGCATVYKPLLWLLYVGDTFVVWPRGTTVLQSFFKHISSLGQTRKFTM